MLENTNRLIYMCFAMIKCSCFSPEVKKPSVQSILGLYSLFRCMQLPENQFKGNLNTSNRMKEAKTEGKKWPSLVFVPSGHKNETQSP